MLTLRNYAILAATTLVLFVVAGVIGPDKDVLYFVDDLIWYGFLLSALLLIVMTVVILVRAITRRGEAADSR